MERIEWTEMMDIDALLRLVHERIGNPPGGLTINGPAVAGGPLRVTWRRSYEGVLSDERDLEVESGSLRDCLRAIMAWEDDADLEQGPPAYVAVVNMGDDHEVRRYLVYAGDKQEAADLALSQAQSLVDVVVTRISNPDDQDEIDYDGVLREADE